MVYVENDFLFALANPDDWLHDDAVAALDEHDEVHTSLVAYAELLVLVYDREDGDYSIDVGRTIGNLVETVPVRPEHHEQAILTAAVIADEHGFTPFDAIHAGIAITSDVPVLSSERDYEILEVDRIPLEPEEE